jgi:fumarylacetoacetase
MGANFSSMPLAYHGRSSSIVVSGTDVHRPSGQYLKDGVETFGPSQKLDFELELGVFVGKPSQRGKPIAIDQADDHIFGYVLMNDWSARDIQQFEAQPLGPFNGKNFCTTISPWVIPPEALKPFRTELRAQVRSVMA